MNIAMIPARGGSKRIPRKNIKPFHGKPIIAYSIDAARASGLFDEIIVSTDDEEIAAVARNFGANTPFTRPDALADDHSTTLDVIAHTIDWYSEMDVKLDRLCCLYATAPMIRAEDLTHGFEALQEESASFAFSATAFEFPIQRAVRLLPDGGVEMLQPEHLLTRSQDLEPTYHDAGQFYWVKPDRFLAGKGIFSRDSRAVILPSYRVQDIDTEEDWLRAEALYSVAQDARGKVSG
ncbi:pseudaminic acid cytidylyltransferase [Pseudohalioglobus lutimaris]|uniref:Pseudaminic acid cytidylyltransferase n=1 Tax=Pseudohalioglobus lutimaris TaxID=1737061 RepID=A0A2N5X6X6_9GAMM|nr:pseudaminic acid cytidylyltransferase [Pseudohalioglobus lutimaris]PLW70246.1 pseudaminic acid cytidylyltransferase [Pseudohalioglobus lutimaris]